jgi:hypothetical protein
LQASSPVGWIAANLIHEPPSNFPRRFAPLFPGPHGLQRNAQKLGKHTLAGPQQPSRAAHILGRELVGLKLQDNLSAIELGSKWFARNQRLLEFRKTFNDLLA